MEEKIYGILHGVVEDKRLIAIRKKRQVRFYYMSKGMFKNFMMYLTDGIYVFLTVQSKARLYKGYRVQNIINIDKVLSPNKNNPVIYYDISIIKSGVRSIVNQPRYKLFIDFEMTMPPYTNYQNFVSEIIQFGYILVDPYDIEVERKQAFIKPVLFPELSKRTIKFLQIEQAQVDQGIRYIDFYRIFRRIVQKYQPMIFVWGKNDQLELNKMNSRYHLKRLGRQVQFIDLLNLHKIFFRLKNDLGLFNAYNLYADVDLSNQQHDAMEDALVTREIFTNFRKVCNGQMTVEIDA